MNIPTALDILDAILSDRLNLSGAWITDGIAFYAPKRATDASDMETPADLPAPILHANVAQTAHDPAYGAKHTLSDNGSGGGAADIHKRKSQKSPHGRTKDAPAKAYRWLVDHPQDAELSATKLSDKIYKDTRKKLYIGHDSCAKAKRWYSDYPAGDAPINGG